MTQKIDDILCYYSAYGSSLFDAIMAVADVSDLDNDELGELEAALDFGAAARKFVPLIEGNFKPVWEGM